MTVKPSSPRKFGAGRALQGEGYVVVAPAVGREDGGPMSAYTAFFKAGARADLPAPYTEIWVILSGALRVGADPNQITVGAGEFVHIPEQAPGVVEALEDTTLVCVSAPPH